MEKSNFIIYGCYGYTGVLISELAVEQGLKPVLAGRDAAKVKELAGRLKLDYKVFDVSDANVVAENIKDFKAVLHCAGPFIYTAKVMVEACLKVKTHYLDITGEYQVFENNFNLDKQAKAANVLLMSGVGFDVVPTDCLALYLKNGLPDANSLELALYTKGGRLSHGTAITVTENLGEQTLIRKNGSLTNVANGSLLKTITLNGKPVTGVAISWGDISTGYRTTGIPNITVYNVLPGKVIQSMKMSNYIGFLFKIGLVKSYLIKKIKGRPAGPNETERKNAKTIVWGSVKNANGGHMEALLELPEGYTLTALTAIEIAKRVIKNEPTYGARTPAQEFGADFILQFAGVVRRDID